MRKILIFATLLVIFSLLLAACEFTVEYYGYPKSVTFPPDGGTKVVKGDLHFSRIAILDGIDEFSSSIIDDTYVVSHDWLTAKQTIGSHELILIAEPAPSKKKRKLKIFGYFGNEYADIDIIQKK